MKLEAYGGAKNTGRTLETDAVLVAHEDDGHFSFTLEQQGESLCVDLFSGRGRGITLRGHSGRRLVVTVNHDGSLAVRAVEEK